MGSVTANQERWLLELVRGIAEELQELRAEEGEILKLEDALDHARDDLLDIVSGSRFADGGSGPEEVVNRAGGDDPHQVRFLTSRQIETVLMALEIDEIDETRTAPRA